MRRKQKPKQTDTDRLKTLIELFNEGSEGFARELFFARKKRKTELGAFRLALDNYKQSQ